MTRVRPDQVWVRKQSIGTACRVVVLETIPSKVTYRHGNGSVTTISKKTFKSIYRKEKR